MHTGALVHGAWCTGCTWWRTGSRHSAGSRRQVFDAGSQRARRRRCCTAGLGDGPVAWLQPRRVLRCSGGCGKDSKAVACGSAWLVMAIRRLPQRQWCVAGTVQGICGLLQLPRAPADTAGQKSWGFRARTRLAMASAAWRRRQATVVRLHLRLESKVAPFFQLGSGANLRTRRQ